MRLNGRKSLVGVAAKKKWNKLYSEALLKHKIVLRQEQRVLSVDRQIFALRNDQIISQHSTRDKQYYLVSRAEDINTRAKTDIDTVGNSLKNNNQIRLLYNNQLVHFDPTNKYITSPEQLWLLESIIGNQAVRQFVAIKKKINNQYIESLFKNAPFSFYISADGAYLVSSDDELTQLDFGPLTKISALAALQRFGLLALERAKEKTVVRL